MRPYGQQPTRLLCPQDSLGKNTGVGCHFLPQERNWVPIKLNDFKYCSWLHAVRPIPIYKSAGRCLQLWIQMPHFVSYVGDHLALFCLFWRVELVLLRFALDTTQRWQVWSLYSKWKLWVHKIYLLLANHSFLLFDLFFREGFSFLKEF